MKRLLMLIAFSIFINQASAQQSEGGSLIPSSSNLFEFHNGFWINLHHFLYVQARAQLDTRDSQRRAVSGAKKELERIGKLPKDQRDIWESTLNYYRENIATSDILFDRELNKITGLISLEGSNQFLKSKELDPELIQVLAKAAIVYRQQWWPDHEKSNQEWVMNVDPLLKAYESKIEKRLTTLYNNAWPSNGMRVDVCAYTNWAGAYSTWPPQRIAFTSTDADLEDTQGLETLFHEAMHFVERVISRELYQKTRESDKQIPSQFTHAMIFYSAGEVVREIIPSHNPYALKQGIWDRQPWKQNLIIIKEHWQPYLDGEISLEKALTGMVDSFKD